MMILNEAEESFIFLGVFNDPQEVINKLIEEHYNELIDDELYCNENGELDIDLISDMLSQKIGVYQDKYYYLMESF